MMLSMRFFFLHRPKQINLISNFLPRQGKKGHQRVESTIRPVSPESLDLKDALRKDFFELVDTLTAEIHRRFTQPGLDELVRLEGIVTDAARRKPPSAGALEEELGLHTSDFDASRLAAQLLMLPKCDTIQDVHALLKDQAPNVKLIFEEVFKRMLHVLPVPASSASSERSLRALRRMKTCFRSTMSQERLTHLLLLHVHGALTATLSFDSVIQTFVARTAERKSTFGTA
ncbi:unnamed protein product [Ixodes hexagonus]